MNKMIKFIIKKMCNYFFEILNMFGVCWRIKNSYLVIFYFIFKVYVNINRIDKFCVKFFKRFWILGYCYYILSIERIEILKIKGMYKRMY